MTSTDVLYLAELSWSDPQHSSNLDNLGGQCSELIRVQPLKHVHGIMDCEFILKHKQRRTEGMYVPLDSNNHKFLHGKMYTKTQVTLTNTLTSQHHKPFYNGKHIRLPTMYSNNKTVLASHDRNKGSFSAKSIRVCLPLTSKSIIQ